MSPQNYQHSAAAYILRYLNLEEHYKQDERHVGPLYN